MEVYYERYLADPERMRFLKDMLQRYGLLASAGGNRHRDGQPFCTEGDMELFQTMVAAMQKLKTCALRHLFFAFNNRLKNNLYNGKYQLIACDVSALDIIIRDSSGRFRKPYNKPSRQ